MKTADTTSFDLGNSNTVKFKFALQIHDNNNIKITKDCIRFIKHHFKLQ